MSVAECLISSPVGNIRIKASAKGLTEIQMGSKRGSSTISVNVQTQQAKILKAASDQLQQYFNGKRKSFDLPLDVDGTEFQKKVWRALLQIPFGQTVSYADIARKINHPQAMRAVGNANGKNPLCIVVPCHRVIASNGGIGGYSGGLSVKRQLLTIEGIKNV